MDQQYNRGRGIQPWPSPGLAGRLSFTYLTPLVEAGLKKPLEHDDLWVRTNIFRTACDCMHEYLYIIA